MQDAFTRLLARLPFPILELHPDNGREFFNRFLLRYWKDVVPGLTLSRSRPFHKNDNPFVEEKNGSLVDRPTFATAQRQTREAPGRPPDPVPAATLSSQDHPPGNLIS